MESLSTPRRFQELSMVVYMLFLQATSMALENPMLAMLIDISKKMKTSLRKQKC